MKRVRGMKTWRSPKRCCWRTKKRSGWTTPASFLARVIATYSSRRSSSISAGCPVARSEGMQPSATLSMNTVSHSCPFAEWIVDRIR